MIAVEQFPLWQAALFLLLLVIASTYLLEQKLGHLFYARIHEHDLIVADDVEDEQKEEPLFIIKEVAEEKQEEDLQQEQTEETEFEWLERNWPEEVEQHVSIEPLRNDGYDHIIEPLAEMDDVIEPLHIVDGTDVNNERHELDDERWVDLLDEESNELTYNQPLFETEENELLNMDELAVVDEMNDHFVDEKSEIETVIEDDDIVDGQQNEMEMIPVVEEDAIAEKQQDEAESIPIVEEAIVYTDEKSSSAYNETIATEEGNEAIRMLPKPLLKNLLASLYAMRPLLSDEEYEQLIHKHLHPRLHEQDYYTFANVLMEHYIASKQYEKLYDVAKQLYGQYELYPIIQQQLAHMIHYAEQKMGWKK